MPDMDSTDEYDRKSPAQFFSGNRALADFIQSSVRPDLSTAQVTLPPPSSHGFVAIIGDEVFKAPHDASLLDAFQRETLVQDYLRRNMAAMGHLVPGLTTNDTTGKQPLFGMKKAEGEKMTSELVASLPPEQQDTLARDLAQFMLAARAAVSPDVFTQMKLEKTPDTVTPETLAKSLGNADVQKLLGPALLAKAQEAEKDFADFSKTPRQQVFAHGDLNAYNLLFDKTAGRLNGVIDFGLAGLKTVEEDFTKLADKPKAFLQLVAKHYEEGGGGKVDVERVLNLRSAILLDSLQDLVGNEDRKGYMQRVTTELGQLLKPEQPSRKAAPSSGLKL